MRERLIAYLLNDLSTDERIQVEILLRRDSSLRQEYEWLKSCFEECENVADDDTQLPEDLTTRTCCLIQNASCRDADQVAPMADSRNGDRSLQRNGEYEPPSLMPGYDARCGPGQRWSLLDLTVAGGILATLAMLLLPALHQGREASRRLTGQNNLRAIGQALIRYAEQHRRDLPRIGPEENAGIFAVRLARSGMIDSQQLAKLLVCPSSPLAEEIFTGRAEIRIPTARQLARANPQKLLLIRRRMGGSYAYRLGYFHQGAYHDIPFTGRSDSPMLADAPAPQTDGFYSSYHGGCGQNCGEHILFQDWSVRFCRPCVSYQQLDDIYLNADRQQAAGKGPRDIVLGRSEVRPDGRGWLRWP